MFEKFKEKLKNIAKFVFAANTGELPAELSAPASYQKRSKFKNLDEFCAFVNDENNFNRESADKESIATATAQFIADHMDDIVELLSFEPLYYNLQGKLAPAMERIVNAKGSSGLNVEKIKPVNVTKQEAVYFLSERQTEEVERIKNFALLREQLEKWNELVETIEETATAINASKENAENIKTINKEIVKQIEYCTSKIAELGESKILDSYTPWKVEGLEELDCLAEQAKFIKAIDNFMEEYTLLEESNENAYTFCKNGINDFSAHTLLEAIASSDNFISINIDAMSEINKATDFESLHKVHLFMTKAQVAQLSKKYKQTHPTSTFANLPRGEQLKLYNETLESCNNTDRFYIDHCLTKYIVEHVADFKKALEIVAFENTKTKLEKMKFNNLVESDTERNNVDTKISKYTKLISSAKKTQNNIRCYNNNSNFIDAYTDINYYGIVTYSDLDHTTMIYELTKFNIPKDFESKVAKFPTADMDMYNKFINETYKTKVTDVLKKLMQEVEGYPDFGNIEASIELLSKDVKPEFNLANKIEKHNKIISDFTTEINKNLDATTEVLPD